MLVGSLQIVTLNLNAKLVVFSARSRLINTIPIDCLEQLIFSPSQHCLPLSSRAVPGTIELPSTLIMFMLAASFSLLTLSVVNVQSIPVSPGPVLAPRLEDWKQSLSNDTSYRFGIALAHLNDTSAAGQAFRNDTIMR